MKNLLLTLFAVILLASCSKDTALLNDVNLSEDVQLSNLSVAAVYASSSITTGTTTAATQENQACGANYVENTEVALFYEQEGITLESNTASANYHANTGSGVAYFNDLKPGNYTVMAINEMGSKFKIQTVTVGSNDVTIEF